MNKIRSAILLIAAAMLFAAPATAFQDQRPDGWRIRLDRENADTAGIFFVTMTPGWHITTGPGAIFFHPDSVTGGMYRLEAEIFLFQPEPGRRGAFGVLVGGRGLDGPGQGYTAFLLREGGEFRVIRRAGSGMAEIRPWTRHEAIVSYAGRPAEANTARNVVAVEVGESAVVFSVNGEEVATLSRAAVDTDGIFGLRVDDAVNLHISRLEAAPPSGG